METRYTIIKNKRELKKLIDCCKATGYACCDYETNAEPIYNKGFKPTILSVSWMPGFGASIPLDHFETKDYTSPGWNWKKMLKKFGEEVIENYDIVKVAWNWKFDDQINQKYQIFYRGTCLDGMLAKYVLNEEKPHDLKSMVRRYLPEHGNYEKQDAFDKIPWDKKELDPLCHYGCQDTDYTLRLMIFFEKKLVDLGMYSVFRNLFMCNSRVLTSVEKEGLYLDTEFNKKLLEEYKPKIDAARDAIYALPRVKKFEKKYNQEKIDKYIQSIEDELEELDYNDPKDKRKIVSREQKISNIKAGIFTTKKEQELIRPINLGSPVDLPALMYSEDGFHFDVIKDNESGKPSTDEETLTNLRLTIKKPDSPKAIFLDKLLELRGLEKIYKTYIYGWWEKVQDDSRLHGRYNIHGTDSNRFSSADPNMQQIPKTSVDPNIKKQLIAPPGYLYMAFDYSQAELRMMAHLSGDETYLDAFAKGADPHLGIAAAKYGVSIEEASKIYEDENHPDHKLWKTRRKQAKQIAFGLIYGIGEPLLAVKLSDPKAGIIVTKEEAHKEMVEFFEKGEYDIMLGTQMIAKGLNFPNVTMVGVISLDKALFTGDFRSYERTFSLLTQVAGRSGRGDKPGVAYIQTFVPDHYVLNLAAEQNYDEFYKEEIALRKSLTYPPFCDICVIGFSAPLESKVIGASRWVTQLIKEYISQHRVNFPLRALGPAPCTFEMINNRYRYRLILKTRNTADFREMIKHVLGEFYKNKDYQTVRIYADINGDIGL